jgi:hypothetical protein
MVNMYDDASSHIAFIYNLWIFFPFPAILNQMKKEIIQTFSDAE